MRPTRPAPAPPKSLWQRHLRLRCCASASSDSNHILTHAFCLGFRAALWTLHALHAHAHAHAHSISRRTALKQQCTTEDMHRWQPGQRCQWSLDRTPAQRRTGRASRLLQTQPARDMVAAVSWRGARAPSAPFLRSWQHAHFASYACTHRERSADAAVEFIAARAEPHGRTPVPPPALTATTYPASW
jgi:hypothetical protein